MAAAHFWVSIIGGPFLSWWLPTLSDPMVFQRVLMFVSFYAITLTSVDWWSTTDVRAEQEDG